MEDYLTRSDIIEQQDKEFEESLRIDQKRQNATSTLEILNSESIERKRERIAKSFQKEVPSQNWAYDWELEQVCTWLDSRALSALKSTFQDNEIDGPTLLSLTKTDIREELKIQKLEYRKRLWEEIQKLKTQLDIRDERIAGEAQIAEIRIMAAKEPKNISWSLFEAETRKMMSVADDFFVATTLDTTSDVKSREAALEMLRQFQQELERSDSNLVNRMLNRRVRELNLEEDPQSEALKETDDITDSSDDDTTEEYIKDSKREEDEPLVKKLPKNVKVKHSVGECQICLEKKKIVELACSTKTCLGCIRTLFLSACKDLSLMPPICCHVPIDPNYSNIVLDEKEAETFLRKYIEATVENKMYCPNERCSVFIRLDLIEDDNGLTCQQAEANVTQEQAAIEAVLTTNNWKRCPRCRSGIELAQGCYHMTCRCGFEFCYSCSAVWRTCQCELWDETRLEREVEFREPVAARRPQLREALRQECRRHNYSRIDLERTTRCMNCQFVMYVYSFHCRNCQLYVCYMCRFHRRNVF